MGESNFVLSIVARVIDNFTSPLRNIRKSLDEVGEKYDEISKKNRGFMGIGFAMLFTGMAIKREFGGALREIFNTYLSIIDVSDQFFQGTQRLRASWEFLKFAMVDALTQSDFFFILLDFVIQLVDKIGEVITKHPDIAKIGIIFLAIGWAVSGVTEKLGMLALAMSGVGLDGLKSFFRVYFIIFLIFVFVGLLIDDLNDGLPTATDKVKFLAKEFFGLLIILTLLFGFAVGLPLAIVATIVTAFWIFRKEIVDAAIWIQNAFTDVSYYVLKAFLDVFIAIWEAFAKLMSKIGIDIGKPKFLTNMLNNIGETRVASRNEAENLRASLYETLGVGPGAEGGETMSDKISKAVQDGVEKSIKPLSDAVGEGVGNALRDSESKFIQSSTGV